MLAVGLGPLVCTFNNACPAWEHAAALVRLLMHLFRRFDDHSRHNTSATKAYVGLYLYGIMKQLLIMFAQFIFNQLRFPCAGLGG